MDKVWVKLEECQSYTTASELGDLKTCLNANAPETPKNIFDLAPLTNASPKDISAYQLKLDAQTIRNGIAIRVRKSSVNYDYFLVYGESQKITVYQLDLTNRKYALIPEYCDINELRCILDDLMEEEGGKEQKAVYAEDEIEIGENGDLGTNLKALINDMIDEKVTEAMNELTGDE